MTRLKVERYAATATWRQWRGWLRWRRRLRRRRLLRRRRQRRRRRLRPRGTRQYTKRRRRSASVHETIVDEKLAPSGRDEERESRRREIAIDTHVHERARTPWRTCVCVCVCVRARAVVPRERERERTRKSERGRREIATLATMGAILLHTLFCRKSSRTTSTREKKSTHRSTVYEPPLPSASSTPTASRRHLLAPTILSLFFDPFFLALPLLRDLCTRVCPCDHLRVYVARICTSIPVTCLILGVRVHARDGKRTSRTEMRKGWRAYARQRGKQRSKERRAKHWSGRLSKWPRAQLTPPPLLLRHRRLFLRFYSSSSVDRHAAPPRAETARRFAARYNSNGLPWHL